MPLLSPELISPINGSVDLLLNVTFEWNGVENAVSYALEIANDNSFASPIFNQSDIIDTTLILDESILQGLVQYYWRVNARDAERISDWSDIWSFITEDPLSVESFQSGVPEEFSLFQNYPNPFNPSTNIRYTLPEASHVKIIIVDLLGREVAELYNSFQPAGFYELNWDARNISSGNYIYKIDVKSESGKMISEMKKMQFIK
jgi:hypothetical protein